MSGGNQVPRGARAIVLMIAALGLLTFADLGTKEWALDTLSREGQRERAAVCRPDESGNIQYQNTPVGSRELVPGFINLSYVENCGAAFGMLRKAPGYVRVLVFGVATTMALVLLTLMFVRGHGGRAFAASVPFILSGALGNLTDRARHGFVVDFIQFDPELFHYPSFNVADIAIGVGVGLMLLDGLLSSRQASSPTVTSNKPA